MNRTTEVLNAHIDDLVIELEGMLSINDDYAHQAIANITAELSIDDQRQLLNNWIATFCFDVPTEQNTPVYVINLLSLFKIDGDNF